MYCTIFPLLVIILTGSAEEPHSNCKQCVKLQNINLDNKIFEELKPMVESKYHKAMIHHRLVNQLKSVCKFNSNSISSFRFVCYFIFMVNLIKVCYHISLNNY